MGTAGDRSGGRSRAQSTTIGYVLVLALVVVGTGLVVTLGTSAIEDTQRSATVERAGQSMAQFDSQAATVALGDADQKRVTLADSGEGDYSVRQSFAWLRIEHLNYTGSGDDEVLYNQTIGSVVYENGRTSIAYQAGGVWQSTGDTARMISPPEFHYRGNTLTLPVIQVSGSGGAAGGSTALVSSTSRARPVYPNSSTTGSGVGGVGSPYDADTDGDGVDDDPYGNPIENGTVQVTVHSKFYEGWASYFRSRTEGNVSVDHANRLATANLTAISVVGQFQMPDESKSLTVPGYPPDAHALDAFELELKAQNSGRDFNNLHWTFWTNTSEYQFEMHMHSPAHCSQLENGNKDMSFSIFYRDQTDASDRYQGWQNGSITVPESTAFDVDCSDYTMDVNLTSETELTYGNITVTGNSNKWQFGDEIKNAEAHPTLDFTAAGFETHPQDTSTVYDRDAGDRANMSYLFNHYFAVLSPSFKLTVQDGPGNDSPGGGSGSGRIDEGGSSGYLDYDAGGGFFVTFLHVTENEVRVEFN